MLLVGDGTPQSSSDMVIGSLARDWEKRKRKIMFKLVWDIVSSQVPNLPYGVKLVRDIVSSQVPNLPYGVKLVWDIVSSQVPNLP